MMFIDKKPIDSENFRLHWSYFKSARLGFQQILEKPALKGKKIFIPAYIGYSSREGSGVFDPIRKTKTAYAFYRMDNRLNIQSEKLIKQIKSNPGNVLLLIHYFGFKDKNLEFIKQTARKNKFIIIEDCAHAFFTFSQNPVMDADYVFFSIHKMFPKKDGGIVLSREKMPGAGRDHYGLLEFNFKLISQQRIENYSTLLKILSQKSASYGIEILKSNMKGAVPQTMPILLKDERLRDYLYFELNKKGYGVVSLYHQLISEINEGFQTERNVSQRILNLPVHQDADPTSLKKMAEVMFKLIKSYRSRV